MGFRHSQREQSFRDVCYSGNRPLSSRSQSCYQIHLCTRCGQCPGGVVFRSRAGWPVDLKCDGGSSRGSSFDRFPQPGPGSLCRRQHRHRGSEFWSNRGELLYDSLAHIQWQPARVRRRQSGKLFQFASVLRRSKQLTVGSCCELGSPIPRVLGE